MGGGGGVACLGFWQHQKSVFDVHTELCTVWSRCARERRVKTFRNITIVVRPWRKHDAPVCSARCSKPYSRSSIRVCLPFKDDVTVNRVRAIDIYLISVKLLSGYYITTALLHRPGATATMVATRRRCSCPKCRTRRDAVSWACTMTACPSRRPPAPRPPP